MAIRDNALRTSSSSASAMLAGSVCHPDLDTDCHVALLLAMTIIHLGRVREHELFQTHDHIDGRSPPRDCKQRLWALQSAGHSVSQARPGDTSINIITVILNLIQNLPRMRREPWCISKIARFSHELLHIITVILNLIQNDNFRLVSFVEKWASVDIPCHQKEFLDSCQATNQPKYYCYLTPSNL